MNSYFIGLMIVAVCSNYTIWDMWINDMGKEISFKKIVCPFLATNFLWIVILILIVFDKKFF